MISLKDFTTFGVDATCTDLRVISDTHEAIEAFNEPSLILGGGSNLLFRENYPGCILKNDIKGREVIEENNEDDLVEFGGGEVWHEIVTWCVDHNYGGIENLSLIPGSVGAAPIQNIGAYGVELKDVFYSLKGVHVGKGVTTIFNKSDCEFGYRSSVFKKDLKNKFFITHVTLRLTKKNHLINIQYGELHKYLIDQKMDVSCISDISKTVIDIRNSKLPNPDELGNAGSFFKNPIISIDEFNSLKHILPDIKSYPNGDKMVKISAAMLIDNAGWRGKKIGDAGVYKNHALVLVNHGKAKGKDIWQLACDIQYDVFSKYGVNLEPEVNVVP